MKTNNPTNFKYAYWAFISYNKSDDKMSKKLFQKLDGYRVSKVLLKESLFIDQLPNRLRVFRDQEEISASPSLNKSIEDALLHSKFLIVLCSKSSANSKWVNEEVKIFQSLGRSENIIQVLLDGTPNAINNGLPPDCECLVPVLRDAASPSSQDRANNILNIPEEPLYIDLRARGEKENIAIVRILSRLIGVKFDDVFKRWNRQRRWRFFSLAPPWFYLLANVLVIVLITRMSFLYRDYRITKEGIPLVVEFILSNQEKLDVYISMSRSILKDYDLDLAHIKNLQSARHYLSTASNLDHGEAEYLLASTFDPNNLYGDIPKEELNIAKAIELYKISSDSGYVESDLELGKIFLNSRNVPYVDYAAALIHFRKAVKSIKAANVYLAQMHEKGFGVERDVSEAMKLFLEYAIWELGEEQKKSEKNRKWVQFSFLVNQEKMSVHYYLLSNYRLLCPGFKDNSDLFTKWSNQLVSVYAANKTRVDGALSYLENSCLTNNNELYEPIDVSRVPDNILQETREALKYELGKDKPRSLNKAFEFYRLAHAKGDDFAAYMEARYLAEGVVFPADEISAHEKFLELANKGLAAAQNAIGVDFQTGIGGVQKDFREAFKWFMLAAAQGEPIAQSNIGKMLKDGTSGKFSLKESVDWFRKGAASGNPYAQCNLAYAYLNGDGVKADLQEALKLFKVSADNGSYHCQLQLGKLIEADKRVEAIHYYQLAAKHNKGEAEFRLAILLLESAQSSKDITAALNWLHKAAQNQHGTRLLAEMYEKGKYVEQSNSKALYWYQFSKNSPNDVARLEMLAKYELDKN